MPVRPAALVEAGLATEDELPTLTVDPPRHLETSADRFAVLGDVLPLAPLNEVVSFGDLIVVAGAADAVRELARRRRQRWNDREVDDRKSVGEGKSWSVRVYLGGRRIIKK